MVAPSASASDKSRSSQTAIGLALSLLVVGGLAMLHIYTVFMFDLSLASLPAALLLAAIQCWLFVGVFIIAHDAMHGSLAPGHPRLNDRIGALLVFLYAGFSWRKMRAAHFDHHKFAGTARDPDFSVDAPTRFAPWYFGFMTRYFGWGSLFFVSGVVALYHFAGGAEISNILLFYAVPTIGSSVQLFYFGTFRPHRHGPHGFGDRHNARSDDFGTLASLASCFHFGYHHEHHVHPDTPWWALPRLHGSTQADLQSGADAQERKVGS